MQDDIKRNIPYILQKIKDNGLSMHSFYFYVFHLNDAEEENNYGGYAEGRCRFMNVEKRKLGDAISSATYSSTTILKAIENALIQQVKE